MKEKPIFVTGHLNPDTDAIASCIAYANLKKELGYNCVAARIGHTTMETEYLLNRFGFEEPLHIYSGRCSISDIDIDDACLVTKDVTMKEALDLVLQRKNKGVFVVNEKKRLEGVVSVSNLTSLWTVNEEVLRELMSSVKLDNVIRTLKASVLVSNKNFKTSGKIEFFPSISGDNNLSRGCIAIVSNQPEVQRRCIDAGVSLIVIVGENWMDSVTLQRAEEANVAVIHTPLSPLAVSQLIFQSPSVENIMAKDVISFNLSETVEDASARMAKTRHRTYPVLDENQCVVGAISRYHLFNYQKKQFILMDHNELKQSVPDIEFAEIVEIVDHHRLGGIKTANPINYSCMVVGSTCTIVALKYFEYNIPMTKEMAGLMLGGILADTLNLKSPTTAKQDREMVKKLSEIAMVDSQELAQGIVDASASILDKRFVDIVYEDFKEFSIEGNKIAISQTQCKSKDEFLTIKDSLQDYLNEVCTMNKYDVLLILLTNPSGSGSYYLVAGQKRRCIKKAFMQFSNEEGFAKGFISRKKQVVPLITEILTVA